DVLVVTTFEFGHPVALVVPMKSGDATFHAVDPSSASSMLGPCHAAPSKDNRSCVSIRSTSRLIERPHDDLPHQLRIGESWRLRHSTRLLDVPQVVSEYKAPAVQHTIGDDLDEWRRHD